MSSPRLLSFPVAISASAEPRSRVQYLDAIRGAAMLLVLVAHFGIFYFGTAGAYASARLCKVIGWPATPTFIILSGLTLGMLYRERGAQFPSLRLKLIDRALFLLVPGHLLILLAHHWVERLY